MCHANRTTDVLLCHSGASVFANLNSSKSNLTLANSFVFADLECHIAVVMQSCTQGVSVRCDITAAHCKRSVSVCCEVALNSKSDVLYLY